MADKGIPPSANSKPSSKDADPKAAGAVAEQEIKRKLIYRDQIHDKATRQTRLVKSAPKQKLSKKYSRCVLLIRRIFSERMVYVETEVDVKGEFLLEELKELHRDTHGVSLGEGNQTISPELLYWSIDSLMRRLDELNKEEHRTIQQNRTIFEIEAVKEFVNKEYESLIGKLKVLLAERKITFEALWAILPPSALIYAKDEFGEDRVYRLRSHFVGQQQDGSRALYLKVVYTDSDGTRLGVAKDRLIIPQFQGAVPITSLPAYPVWAHPDRLCLRTGLLSRGRLQLKFHSNAHHHRDHEGFALKLGQRGIVKFNTHGRMIVDAVTYKELEPENNMVPDLDVALPKPSRIYRAPDPFGYKPPAIEISGETEEGPSTEEGESAAENASSENSYYLADSMPETAVIMLSGRLYGFSLGDSEWGAFAVTRVDEINWDPTIFESLEMPLRAKKLLRRLIEAHGQGDSGFDDVVKDKGKGLVGLLKGPPGVGKTLTAEAVAEIAELPLFRMSCGGLGNSASHINESLQRYLELATRWKAVLLLDEADVYLTKRNENDLERNAIISVFLREIEYYTGILLLTTNLAHNFDPAFQSRIHFCHHYSPHDFNARKKIWNSFITRARENKKIKVDIDTNGLGKLATQDFNGRQIKNAMSIAVTLAASGKNDEEKVLRADDIIDVSQLLQNFDFKDGDTPAESSGDGTAMEDIGDLLF